MKISLYSFGFKHTAPPEADLVWDVRFLPNPYWVPALKSLNGRDPQVALHVLDNESGREFLSRLEPLLAFLLDQYEEQQREELVIAVGCTGGVHRSVAVVEHLHGILDRQGRIVRVSHRDIAKQ